eukprot:3681189-Prymnesium_polylepis.1
MCPPPDSHPWLSDLTHRRDPLTAHLEPTDHTAGIPAFASRPPTPSPLPWASSLLSGRSRLQTRPSRRQACHIRTYHIRAACHTRICPIRICPIRACHIMVCHTRAFPIRTCHTRAYPIRACHTRACHIRTCHIRTCHIRACRIVSPSGERLAPAGLLLSKLPVDARLGK